MTDRRHCGAVFARCLIRIPFLCPTFFSNPPFAMNRFLIAALLACLFSTPSQAQSQDIDLCMQVLSSTGKSTVRAGRYYAYTVGESFIFTLEGQTTDFTQGFHQPDYCLLVSTSAVDLSDWEIQVFPNPTTDLLYIQYSADHNGRLEAVVFDVLGHLMINSTSLNQPEGSSIDCSTWQTGVYFLQLRDPVTQAVATVRFIRL